MVRRTRSQSRAPLRKDPGADSVYVGACRPARGYAGLVPERVVGQHSAIQDRASIARDPG
jgi:hypothetical protein